MDTSLALDQAVIECEPQGSLARASGEAEEVLFVIEGSGALLAGSERHALEPETGAYLPPGSEYGLENDGSQPLRLVSVRVGAPAAAGDGAPAGIVVRRLADQEDQAATTERLFRIVADPSTGLRSATQFVGYIPAARAADHFHTYDEVIFVLEGTGTFSAGDGIRPIGPGSQIELPARTVHCLENTGQGVMRLVAVFRPAGSPAYAYLPDGSPAYPGTPPLPVMNDNPHHP
ncbi:MAG TPA: cupin domain-containing protein [Solirubrobacteraceae bacterium]|nr:cupin domain-containing protein [Solirubrobacteraceae bacterium]